MQHQMLQSSPSPHYSITMLGTRHPLGPFPRLGVPQQL